MVWPWSNSVKTLNLLTDLIKRIEIRLSSLEVELDALKSRWRRKIIPATNEESDGKEPDKLPSDGFDGLRKLNKDHGPQF